MVCERERLKHADLERIARSAPEAPLSRESYEDQGYGDRMITIQLLYNNQGGDLTDIHETVF